jgi:hypothetical protein
MNYYHGYWPVLAIIKQYLSNVKKRLARDLKAEQQDSCLPGSRKSTKTTKDRISGKAQPQHLDEVDEPANKIEIDNNNEEEVEDDRDETEDDNAEDDYEEAEVDEYEDDNGDNDSNNEAEKELYDHYGGTFNRVGDNADYMKTPRAKKSVTFEVGFRFIFDSSKLIIFFQETAGYQKTTGC